MTSSDQTAFQTETKEALRPEYQNSFQCWEVKGLADSNITLAHYLYQDTKDSDCIPVEGDEFLQHQTAKLLYDGTTLLQGSFFIMNFT